MTAKEYLSQYGKLNLEIDAKLEELKELKALAQKVSPIETFTSGNGASDKVGRTVAKIIDLENEINNEIDRLADLHKEILIAINAVPDKRCRSILQLKYINGWTWEKIAEKLDYSYRHVYRLHGYALQIISKNLKNAIECHT